MNQPRRQRPRRRGQRPQAPPRPRQVGPWIIRGRLGGGGNAEVYRAVREGTDAEVALKVLNVQEARREPYRRFAREVEFQQGLTIDDGVLPLIAANVPDEPTPEDQAWLAMPIATPIRDALAGEPLEIVVDAVGVIANNLAKLAERGVAHRDIKPDNLYFYNGQWLVGDFGLIDIPNLNDLTRQGRPLGPAHYTAYELTVDPATPDARPADVYSLGKTLWVLATEQAYPPQGYQAAGVTGFAIADLRPHQRAAQLDQLIDSMTRLPRGQRPTMAQVATDLGLWLELSEDMPPIDISEVQGSIRTKLQRQLTEQELQDLQIVQASAAFDSLRTRFASINDALKGTLPTAVIGGLDSEIRDLLRTHPGLGGPRPTYDRYICSWIAAGADPRSLRLQVGAGVELIDDGTLIIRGLIMCRIPDVVPANYFWQADPQAAPVGSIESERSIELVVQQLIDHLDDGLKAFLEALG